MKTENTTITPYTLTPGRCEQVYRLDTEYKDVALVSCGLSIIGSLVIILTYAKWPDIRTKSRQIVLYISISDFITATGYLLGAKFNLSSLDASQYKTVKWKACEAQSWFTTTSSFCSFLWTDCLAVYLLICVVLYRRPLAVKLFPIYHLVCWGLPVVMTTAALVDNALGPDNSSVSVGWCWVKQECAGERNGSWPKSCLPNRMDIVWQLIDAKGWEILSYLLVAVICVVIKCHLKIETNIRSVLLERQSHSLSDGFETKLLFIPLLFILIRIWGTIRYFMTVQWTVNTLPKYCKSMDYFPWLILLQGIGDPAQGWVNCILYCLLTQKIRSRLFSCCRTNQGSIGNKDIVPSRSPSVNSENEPKYVSRSGSSELLDVASDDRTSLLHVSAEVPVPDKTVSYITGPVCGTTPPDN